MLNLVKGNALTLTLGGLSPLCTMAMICSNYQGSVT